MTGGKIKKGAIFFFTHNNILKSFFIMPLFVLLLTCTSIPSQNQVISPSQWFQKDDSPKTVVILPFDNDTPEKDIEILVRKSFYNHFSSKNYHDFELNEVDSALETLQHASSQAWRDLSPSSLGDLFHADFIIYGKVKEYKKIFMGIYSQIALNVEVEMVECRSGNGFWRKTIIKRSHEGGIPFDLFGIIPAALRSGFHMKKERTIELIDRVNRELVEQIPDPPSPPVAPFYVDIQVASFLEKKSALKTLKKFEGEGLKPRIETVILGDRTWHRILLGPYYELSEAEKIRNTIAQNSQFKPIFVRHYPDSKD